jgi:hypothetical protein
VVIDFAAVMAIDFVAMIADHFVVVIDFVVNKASSVTCCCYLIDETENFFSD